jgi:hypothetical protein
MKRLRGDDEVHARIFQRGGLGAAFHHAEVGVTRHAFLAGQPHLTIGLDANHAVAVVQENLCQQPRAAAYVGNQVLRRQAASLLQGVYHIVGVARTILRVVFRAIGEADKRGDSAWLKMLAGISTK